MEIATDDIFKFYETRSACHVRSVNYFASLLGHSFPDHDKDKIIEPLRTGYAYIFYNKYHPELRLLETYFELCNDAREAHYKHAPHHIQHYSDVSKIPDLRIYEMVSDWASASFEQRKILKLTDTPLVEKWFQDNLSHLPWTEHQIDLIKTSFDIIRNKTDEKTVRDIWQELIELV